MLTRIDVETAGSEAKEINCNKVFSSRLTLRKFNRYAMSYCINRRAVPSSFEKSVTQKPTSIKSALSWLILAAILSSTFLTLLASFLTPDTNMIASTISDVAAGPFDWVQDMGLYILSAALCVLAYGMHKLDEKRWHWKAGVVTMLVMAAAITIMGGYEQYGDGNSRGLVIHGYLVYTFGGAFCAALLLSIPALIQRDYRWLPLNILYLLTWSAVSVYYYSMGTGWDGLVERLLGLGYLAWLGLLVLSPCGRTLGRDDASCSNG